MDFDFVGLYKLYTNVALLQITRHPEKYQEEAVKAAAGILETRTVTDDERVAAGFIIQQPESFSNFSLPSPDTDLLEDFDPEAALKNSRWFITCFTLMCLFYLMCFYFGARNIYYFFSYDSSSIATALFSLFYLAVIPLSLVAFFRRRRIGWYIILSECFFILLISFYAFLERFEYYSGLNQAAFINYIIPIVIRGIIMAFLFQPRITLLFGITGDLKRKTFFGMAAVTLAVAVMIYIVKNGKPI